MTGLEALKEFKGNNNTILVGRVMGKQHYLDCLQAIEKSLKALEIIKPSLRLVGNCLQAKAPFVDDDHPWVFIKEIIDEEELKLLKGMLE